MVVHFGAMEPAFWHALLWSVATVTGVGLTVQGLIWLLGKRRRKHLTGLHCRMEQPGGRKRTSKPSSGKPSSR